MADVDSLLCRLQSLTKFYKIMSSTERQTLASVSYFLQQVAVSPPPMMEVVPALIANSLSQLCVNAWRMRKGREKDRLLNLKVGGTKQRSGAQTALGGCDNIIHQNFGSSFKT